MFQLKTNKMKKFKLSDLNLKKADVSKLALSEVNNHLFIS